MHGRVRVPGDKSISHRALMFGALAVGETRITGLLEGEDVLATAAAMRALGAHVTRTSARSEASSDSTATASAATASTATDSTVAWTVVGRGVGGLREPGGVLDMGNAGTGARLLMGLVAGHPITATFTGDASLSRRPMGRVTKPLAEMGARIQARSGDRLPLTVSGAGAGHRGSGDQEAAIDGGVGGEALPITYTLPVASAQVKSAVLLCGLNAPGVTTVIEPEPTRDHTENMLRHFGAEVRVTDQADGSRRIDLTGQPELMARDVRVPTDISSAAFPIVAGLVVPGSRLTVEAVGLNPLRAGLVATLKDMGAMITVENPGEEGGEPVGDIVVEAGPLKGITVPADRAPSMIDEYPILCVAAAMADGTTRMEGVGELRVKESDRLQAMYEGLKACGVTVRAGDDWLEVTGTGGRQVRGGATVVADLDHRIAMSFLVLGLIAERPIGVDDASPIDTSFPGFAALINGLGGTIAGPGESPEAGGCT